MRVHDSAEFILASARDSVRAIPTESVDTLLKYVSDAKNVIIFGRGRSGFVGRALAVRLAHLGVRAYVVGETITPPVAEDDLVILISGSGETFSVVVTGRTAKKLGCPVVVLTSNPESTLGQFADFTITIPAERSERQEKLAPLGTLFETAAMIFFDAVVAELMGRLGETEASMRARHATLE